jgi:hypothetical protein
VLPCRLIIAPHTALPQASRGSFASRSESLLTLSALSVLRAFSLLRALCAPYLCALGVNSESSLRASYVRPLTSAFPILATPSRPEQKRGVQNTIRVSPLESAFTNRYARNFFRIRIYENCRGHILQTKNLILLAPFRRADFIFSVPLFSRGSALFHFPYPVTPLPATLTKTAGVYPNSSQYGTLPLQSERNSNAS